jgi:signal transduction histidine kinase
LDLLLNAPDSMSSVEDRPRARRVQTEILAISRSIIESHKGQLWAMANDGPGATFGFHIPCASAATAAFARVS